jgi:hypothetical protein
MVQRVLIDEDWWSKIKLLLKFTLPAFELLRDADTDKPFLGEIYDGMDTMVEKTVEIITQEAPTFLFVDVDFAEHVRPIIGGDQPKVELPLHPIHALVLLNKYLLLFLLMRMRKRIRWICNSTCL